MPIALEAYTADGLLTGTVVADGRLVDLLSNFASVLVKGAVVVPFEGPSRRADGWTTVEVDELLAIVATPDTVTPFHCVWHPIAVDLGPYRLHGDLPALPGFDPSRALARPTGSFILLGHVAIELRAEGDAGGRNEHGYVWIDRYAVDAVASALELGFFFPGALDREAQHAIA